MKLKTAKQIRAAVDIAMNYGENLYIHYVDRDDVPKVRRVIDALTSRNHKFVAVKTISGDIFWIDTNSADFESR